MTAIEIDDSLYIRAQELFDRYEVAQQRMGAGEAFGEFGKEAALENPDLGTCNEALAAALGHAKGDYRRLAAKQGQVADKLRRIVWTFHRAWIDRYGWAHAMPQPSDPEA